MTTLSVSKSESKSRVHLKCQIIPVKAGNLLMPEHLVAEVVPLEGLDSEGNVIWRNRTVPVFDNSDSDDSHKVDTVATRLAIIKSVMGYKGLPYVAIATDGIPYSVVIDPDSLHELTGEGRVCEVAASYVRVGSLVCIVPDLPKVENKLLMRTEQTAE